MTIETGGFEIMASGSVLTHRRQPLLFCKGSLELEVVFSMSDDAADDDYWVDFTQEEGTNRIAVEFHNFKGNFMGSEEPVRIGSFDGKALYLNYLVLTVGPRAERLLNYTYYLER